MTSPKSTTLVIADDHTLLRKGIESLLSQSNPDVHIVGEAGTGAEAIEACMRLKPDVLMLDISMPDMTGTEALKVIAAKCPQTRVIMLTMHSDSLYIRECMSRGASGYILKDAVGEELNDAIATVMQGSVYLRAELAASLWTAEQRISAGSGHPLLTVREYEIAQMIKAGLSNKMIAANLGVSVNTIRTHRANIMKKLNAHSVVELIKSIED